MLFSTQSYADSLSKLKKDLKEAMIAKDDIKKTTIRSLLSTIKNKEIDNKGKELDEFGLFDLYSKLIHQRQDSILEFVKNNRPELVEKEQKEIKIIKNYLNALPVASKEEVDANVLTFLKNLKEAAPDIKMKQVFGKVDWTIMPIEWKASPNVIKSSIVAQFKSVFDH